MRNIPVVTKNLLLINCIAFFAMEILKMGSHGAIDLNETLGLHFFMANNFHVYQLFTYMFMHGGFTHIFFNMFALWMFGCVVESTWGQKKFLFYYIVCGLGAGLCQEVAQYSDYAIQGLSAYQSVNINGGVVMSMQSYLNSWTTVGASGAIYGILLAFAMLYPDNRIFIFPLPVPIKAKWFICIYVVVELFSAMSTTNDGVAHVAHLGGMLFGFLLIKYWRGGSHRQASAFKGWSFNYNRKERAEKSEVDAILEKIKKNGYDSLSSIEKQKLFDHSHK